jgi:rhodanese-related sulfurtransferase
MKATHWMRQVLAAVTMGLALVAHAIDRDHVPDSKRSSSGLHLTALEAADMKLRMGGKVMMIDIRTRAEAMYVGMAASVDFLVPVLDFPEFWEWSDQRNEYVQQSNPNFVKDVEKRLAQMGLTKDDPVILICRSGVRSNAASGLLFEMGFKQAYTVIDGFEGDTAKDGPEKGHRVVNGWKNAKLPWSYKLDKNKMYLDPL